MTKWIAIYTVAVLLGTFMLIGGIVPERWYAGWSWWQRLLLALVGGPFIVVAYVTIQALFEGGVHATVAALRAQPFATVIVLGAVGTVVAILVA
jgi:hypothetical protein